MNILRVAFFLPTLASAFWLIPAIEPVKSTQRIAYGAVQKDNANLTRESSAVNLRPRVVDRHLRIESVLLTLDQVAGAVAQMSPENAARIEPVLEDIAEQTLEINDREDDGESGPEMDQDLAHIEKTLGHLLSVMSKMVEPEATL